MQAQWCKCLTCKVFFDVIVGFPECDEMLCIEAEIEQHTTQHIEQHGNPLRTLQD